MEMLWFFVLLYLDALFTRIYTRFFVPSFLLIIVGLCMYLSGKSAHDTSIDIMVSMKYQVKHDDDIIQHTKT